MSDDDDPYAVLGVPRGASAKAARAAYVAKVKKFPPDRAPDQFARMHRALQRVLGLDPPPWLPPPLPVRGRDAVYERLVAHLDAGDRAALRRDAEAAAGDAEAMRDPDTVSGVLRACGVLAWEVPGMRTLVAPVAAAARALELGPLVTLVEDELDLADRYRAVGDPGAFGPAVRTLFGEPLLASPARRRAAAEALAIYLADPLVLGGLADRVVATDGALARRLAERLQRESPAWSDRALASLPEPLREHLSARIRAVRDPTRRRRLVFTGAGAVVGTGVTLLTWHPYIGVAAGAMVALAGVASDDWRYRRDLRPQLASILADLGVQSDTFGAWMQLHPGELQQLAPYRNLLVDDVGLALFGAIAAFVRDHARAAVDAGGGAYR